MGMTKLRTATLTAAVLALSACVNLGGSKPPPFLLTLDADEVPAAGTMRSSADAATLTVMIPSAPQKLRTPRIPVQQGDGAVTYIVEAQWVEAPQRLFQRLLADTLGAKSKRLILDESIDAPSSGEQLVGQLLEFGVDARTNEAVVVYQAMIVSAGGKTMRQQRFAARSNVAVIDGPGAARALTRAANMVAADVTKWVEP